MRIIIGALYIAAMSAVYASDPASGLRPGDEVSAWEPIHVSGPHAGTKTCPVCTYLEAPVLLAFAKDVDAAEKITKSLEQIATAHRSGKLKVILVVVNGSEEQLRKLATDYSLQTMMLCRPDPLKKEKQLKAYKIDAADSNSVVLYQDYTVKKAWTVAKATDLADVKTATDAYLPKR